MCSVMCSELDRAHLCLSTTIVVGCCCPAAAAMFRAHFCSNVATLSPQDYLRHPLVVPLIDFFPGSVAAFLGGEGAIPVICQYDAPLGGGQGRWKVTPGQRPAVGNDEDRTETGARQRLIIKGPQDARWGRRRRLDTGKSYPTTTTPHRAQQGQEEMILYSPGGPGKELLLVRL